MSLSREFCENRAQEAADAAADATLANVRDRELRSEAAWRAMSDRIRSTEIAREAKEAERAAGRAAETAALWHNSQVHPLPR